MTEFLYWLVAIFTVGRTVTGSVRHSLGREDKVKTKYGCCSSSWHYNPTVSTPLAEERLQHVLGELDDVDVPGLRGVQTGDVFLLLTSQLGVVEEVTVGTAIQETLEQRNKCKMCRNAWLEIDCRFLEVFFCESILFAGGLVSGIGTKYTIYYNNS